MKIIIPVILMVLHGLCLAQVPSGIIEYRVGEKHPANKTRVLMGRDTVLLLPENMKRKKQLSVNITGHFQDYQLDIAYDEKDTSGIFSAVVYRICPARITRKDRKSFPDGKIIAKNIWFLRVKQTPLTAVDCRTFINIVEGWNLKQLDGMNKTISELEKFIINDITYRIHLKKPGWFFQINIPDLNVHKSASFNPARPLVFLLESSYISKPGYQVITSDEFQYQAVNSNMRKVSNSIKPSIVRKRCCRRKAANSEL